MKTGIKPGFQILIMYLWLVLILASSCGEPPRPVKTTSHLRLSDDKLIEYNRGIMKTEDQEIEDFLTRYNWDVKRTSTGLRYLIYQQGQGRKATTGMNVRCKYSLTLLDGRHICSSDSLNTPTIDLGHGGIAPGLEEGLMLLCEGDRAKFIIPSHLGFGLLGDQSDIPPGATLVYDVELLEIKPNN